MQYNTIQYNTIQYNTIQYNTIQYNTTIEANTLDNIIGEDKATFIKMDIEGAELNAIHGCVSVITQHKPKLAISVYHKKEDIYIIPILLKQFLPSYRFYLRHYTDTAADTVLYAVQ
jgi:hypothetical protein